MTRCPMIAAAAATACLVTLVTDTYGQGPGREDLINQSAREELIAKGAEKLGPADLRALLSGATLSGIAWYGDFYAGNYKPNGVLTATSSSSRWELSFEGKWHVNDQGQYCWEGIWWGTTGRHHQTGCQDFYKLGPDYYTIGSGKIMKREVKK